MRTHSVSLTPCPPCPSRRLGVELLHCLRRRERADIIDAVLPLLIERGATATSREVAAAAGVSEGTIFNVFADKDELIDAVIEAALDPEPLERRSAPIDPRHRSRTGSSLATELVQRRVIDIWRLFAASAPRSPAPTRRADSPTAPASCARSSRRPRRLRVEPADAARRCGR